MEFMYIFIFRKWRPIYEDSFPILHNYGICLQPLFKCTAALLHTNSSSFVILIDEVCVCILYIPSGYLRHALLFLIEKCELRMEDMVMLSAYRRKLMKLYVFLL